MVREGPSINPTAVAVHVVAIALGLYLGWIIMSAITPDLASTADPGVTTSVEMRGDSPESLYRSPNLAPALAQLTDQLGAGEGVVSLRIEPDGIEAETASGAGFAPADVDPEAPLSLTLAVNALRDGKPIGLGEIGYMELVETKRGPRWYIQLDINRDIGPPPWTYGAPLEGVPLEPGGAPPKPIE